jgi:arylsulfatase A-like enzyme
MLKGALAVLALLASSLGATLAGAATPSFVVVLADDMGNAQLEAMARVRQVIGKAGTTFRRAFVESPICAPSRATFHTGKLAHNHGVVSTNTSGVLITPQESDSLAVRLRDAGYRTAFYGKYVNRYLGNYTPPGWSHWRGFVHTLAYDATVVINGSIVPVPGHSDTWMRDRAAELVRKTPITTPLLLVIAPTAPHLPHLAPPRHAGTHAGAQVPRGLAFNEADVSDKPAIFQDPLLTPVQVQALDLSFAASLDQLQAVDEIVGHVYAALRDTGRLADTYLIFTSDNGIHFGQHRQREDKTHPWETDVRVPFLVRGPGVPVRTDRQTMIGNADTPATILELAGLSSAGMDGASFAAALHGGAGIRTAMPITFWDQSSPYRLKWKGVRTARHTWVQYREGPTMLYDNEVDPGQLVNITKLSSSAGLRAELSALTERLTSCVGSAACSGAAPDRVTTTPH